MRGAPHDAPLEGDNSDDLCGLGGGVLETWGESDLVGRTGLEGLRAEGPVNFGEHSDCLSEACHRAAGADSDSAAARGSGTLLGTAVGVCREAVLHVSHKEASDCAARRGDERDLPGGEGSPCKAVGILRPHRPGTSGDTTSAARPAVSNTISRIDADNQPGAKSNTPRAIAARSAQGCAGVPGPGRGNERSADALQRTRPGGHPHALPSLGADVCSWAAGRDALCSAAVVRRWRRYTQWARKRGGALALPTAPGHVSWRAAGDTEWPIHAKAVTVIDEQTLRKCLPYRVIQPLIDANYYPDAPDMAWPDSNIDARDLTVLIERGVIKEVAESYPARGYLSKAFAVFEPSKHRRRFILDTIGANIWCPDPPDVKFRPIQHLCREVMSRRAEGLLTSQHFIINLN